MLRAVHIRNFLSPIFSTRASSDANSSSRVSFFSTNAENGTIISGQHRKAVIANFYDLVQGVEVHRASDDISSQKSNVESNGAGKRPLWLGLSSLGCHWPGMGKSLMDIPVFAESIKNSTRVLGEVSLDVMSCILDDTARVTDIVQNSLATIVIELALIDVLHRVGLQPDGIIGLSLAEFGCGYADGAMSARQTLLTAYQFASIIAREHQGKHAMAAICMTNEQFKERSPKGIHIGFDGGNISGIGGMKDDVIDFMDELKAQDISGNLVDTGGIAFHTSLIAGCRDEVSMATEKLFPQPRKRSPRWLSTSIPLKSWNTASPVLDSQYYINNVFEVANLIQVVAFIPQDAILVEVGPNRFLLSFLKHEVGDDAILVPLLEGDNNNHNLDVFLGGLARIHAHGHHVDIEKLFIS